jgi:hypothetical protein
MYVIKALKNCAIVLVKSNPITGLDRPLGFQEFEAHRFIDKVVRLSALRTGRFNPPGKISGTHFC